MATSIEPIKKKLYEIRNVRGGTKELNDQAEALINGYQEFVNGKRSMIESLLNKEGDIDIMSIRQDIVTEQTRVIDEIEKIYSENLPSLFAFDFKEPNKLIERFNEAIEYAKKGKSVDRFIRAAVINKPIFIGAWDYRSNQLRKGLQDLYDEREARISAIKEEYKQKEDALKADISAMQTQSKESMETYISLLNELIIASKPTPTINVPFESLLSLPEEALLQLVDICQHQPAKLYENIQTLIKKDYSKVVSKLMSLSEYDEIEFANSESDHFGSLLLAIDNGATKVANMIIDKLGSAIFNYEKPNPQWMDTFLIRSAYYKSPIAIRLIKEFGEKVKVGQANRNKMTALIVACYVNNSECAEQIIETFGDECLPNHTDNNGMTALVYARSNNMTKVITMLEMYVID